MASSFARRSWLGAVIWAAAILVVSSIPNPSLGPSLFPGCDKIAHFIEYLILGLALRYWVGSNWAMGAAALGFAALDEIHQRFIPGRQMSFWDFAADAAGLAVGYFILGQKIWAGRKARDAQQQNPKQTDKDLRIET